MYNIAIFDDNTAIQERIVSIVDLHFSGCFNFITAAKGADLIASASVIDVLIIDINIEKRNRQTGIDIAKKIKNNNNDCQVIFVSGFSEYAQEIFEARPIFFIQKPIEEKVLVKAVTLAIDNLSRGRDKKFCYQKEGKVFVYAIQDIVYFESNKRTVKIVTLNEADVFYDTLNAIEDRIEGEFLRIHQSYLVNPRYISSFNGNEITLNDGRVLPVSKPRMSKVKEEMIRLFSKSL